MDTRATARALKTELEVLVQTSEAEGRLMTDDEKTLYDTKFAELEATLEQIKRQDLLAEMNTSFEEPATATIGARAAQPPTEEADADVEVRMGKDRQNERGFDNIGEQLGAIAPAAGMAVLTNAYSFCRKEAGTQKAKKEPAVLAKVLLVTADFWCNLIFQKPS